MPSQTICLKVISALSAWVRSLDQESIPANEIVSIEVETIDGAKTTLAIAGGIVLLPFAILGLFMGAAAGDPVEG